MKTTKLHLVFCSNAETLFDSLPGEDDFHPQDVQDFKHYDSEHQISVAFPDIDEVLYQTVQGKVDYDYTDESSFAKWHGQPQKQYTGSFGYAYSETKEELYDAEEWNFDDEDRCNGEAFRDADETLSEEKIEELVDAVDEAFNKEIEENLKSYFDSREQEDDCNVCDESFKSKRGVYCDSCGEPTCPKCLKKYEDKSLCRDCVAAVSV